MHDGFKKSILSQSKLERSVPFSRQNFLSLPIDAGPKPIFGLLHILEKLDQSFELNSNFK